MSIHRRAAVIIAVLSAGPLACGEQPVGLQPVLTGPAPLTAPGHDLDLTLTLPWRTGSVGAPSRTLSARPPDLPDDYDLQEALIVKATSNPYVGHGSAGNQAKTTFTGNRIKVDVYTTVTFLAEPIVTEFLQTTQDTYFLPQTEKHHDAFSSVRIEGSCGHTASGHAQHIAWIDYGPYEWGETERPSSGGRYSQPACETDEVPVEDSRTGGGESGPAPGDIYTCWYRYYYDIDTGEILDVELLYCETI